MNCPFCEEDCEEEDIKTAENGHQYCELCEDDFFSVEGNGYMDR